MFLGNFFLGREGVGHCRRGREVFLLCKTLTCHLWCPFSQLRGRLEQLPEMKARGEAGRGPKQVSPRVSAKPGEATVTAEISSQVDSKVCCDHQCVFFVSLPSVSTFCTVSDKKSWTKDCACI